MTVLDGCFLRVCGFMAGDCRTERAGFLDATDVVFLRDFLTGGTLPALGYALKSMFMSIGEVVSEVSEFRTAPYTDL